MTHLPPALAGVGKGNDEKRVGLNPNFEVLDKVFQIPRNRKAGQG
jgi:hypothetical protein